MAIWDLIDGYHTANEIANELAVVCKVNIKDIDKYVYMQLATLQKIGFVEEIKDKIQYTINI